MSPRQDDPSANASIGHVIDVEGNALVTLVRFAGEGVAVDCLDSLPAAVGRVNQSDHDGD
jgi:hypothetical protein